MPNLLLIAVQSKYAKKKTFQFLLPHVFKSTLFPTLACPAPSSYVASWRRPTRTCAVLVVVATAIYSLVRLQPPPLAQCGR